MKSINKIDYFKWIFYEGADMSIGSLIVKFIGSNEKYVFPNIPLYVYDGFHEANSRDEYFDSKISKNYKFIKNEEI